MELTDRELRLIRKSRIEYRRRKSGYIGMIFLTVMTSVGAICYLVMANLFLSDHGLSLWEVFTGGRNPEIDDITYIVAVSQVTTSLYLFGLYLFMAITGAGLLMMVRGKHATFRLLFKMTDRLSALGEIQQEVGDPARTNPAPLADL